jgi:acetate kinase
MNILVINSGSSSLKLALIEPESQATLCQGLAENLGTDSARIEITADGEKQKQALPGASHQSALEHAFAQLSRFSLAAIGHRVVHGGEAFVDSVILDDASMSAIRAASDLAPLHNPANLLGIEAARARFAELPNVAVFDTAFHQTLEPKAFLYALPYELYERHRIRRYGFHGTSHRFVAGEAAKYLRRPLGELELLTAHLGNGCSACAIRAGRSVDTTMGFTPLEGLVMGTRSGDVDPNLHEFLVSHLGYSLAQVGELLNRKSGLLGLSGTSNDMRTLLAQSEAGDARAKIAIDVFCYRLAKALLGLCAGLQRIDALVFTGGIGERAAPIRDKTLASLRLLNPLLDPALNSEHGRAAGGRITKEGSALLALVIPTNEELFIARETARLLTPSTS